MNLALLLASAGALEEVYTKYASEDTFVKSCNGIYETASAEKRLYVRRHSFAAPTPRTEALDDTGLCGVEDMGDRETYLRFDFRDFSVRKKGHFCQPI